MNPQVQQLLIAYGVTAAAMLAYLLAMRASASAYWRWPLYSALGLVLGAVTWSLMRRHMIPAQWTLLYPAALYYGALALYALFGIALGVLLRRLTRRKTPTEDNSEEVMMKIPGPRPPPDA